MEGVVQKKTVPTGRGEGKAVAVAATDPVVTNLVSAEAGIYVTKENQVIRLSRSRQKELHVLVKVSRPELANHGHVAATVASIRPQGSRSITQIQTLNGSMPVAFESSPPLSLPEDACPDGSGSSRTPSVRVYEAKLREQPQSKPYMSLVVSYSGCARGCI
nr:unnamed protein product [Spirometra erinaceieuropaei]